MDLYSGLLLASMIAVGASIIALVVPATATRLQLGVAMARLALALAVVTTVFHLGAGHAPGSESELGFFPFIQEHPALPIVALGALFVRLALTKRARRFSASPNLASQPPS